MHLCTTLLFAKRQHFRLVQIESVCRQQIKSDSKLEICFGKERKHCGKREKMLVTSIFSFFPKCFQKASFSASLKVVIMW